MPPPLNVFARRRHGQVTFEQDAVPVAIALPGLRTADGHDAVVHLSASVRPVDRPADVRLFEEQLLTGRDTVEPQDVTRHFSAALAPAAADYTTARTAADLLAGRAAFETHLRQRFDAVAFACGLELAAPLSLTVESPSWRDHLSKLTARQRQQADAEHAAKLAESLASVGPAHRLAVTDQAGLLPTILAAMPARPAVLAAGPNVVTIDGNGDLRTIAAPAEVGPLRCVRRIDDSAVAVGGTTGVALLDASFAPIRVLPGGGTGGRGYNAVARLPDGRIAATHGEIGLTLWNADGRSEVFATPGPSRAVVSWNGGLALAAGSTACTFDTQTVTPVVELSSTIVAVLPFDDAAVFVAQDGTFAVLGHSEERTIHRVRLPATVTAAATLVAGGMRAIVVADDRGNVDVVDLDGRTIARVASRAGPIKMLTVAGGRLFGVTGDRASVRVWDAPGGTAARSINVLSRTGQHVTALVAG